LIYFWFNEWPRSVLNIYLQLHISDEWFTSGTLTSCNDEHDRPNVAQYIYILWKLHEPNNWIVFFQFPTFLFVFFFLFLPVLPVYIFRVRVLPWYSTDNQYEQSIQIIQCFHWIHQKWHGCKSICKKEHYRTYDSIF
jgi:hypothetical protein